MILKTIAGLAGKGAVRTGEVVSKSACYIGEGTCAAVGGVSALVATGAIATVIVAFRGEQACIVGRGHCGQAANDAVSKLEAWAAEPPPAHSPEPVAV